MLRYHSRDQNTYNTDLPPISRTIRYKKFTKPLLERKRRARMNKCLDELKLLVGTLEAEGENINKLEKADILELTVRYIKRISRLQDPVREAHRFQAGFSQCASEACKFLLSLPGLNSAVGNRLIDHLQQCLKKPRFHHQDSEHRLQMPSDSRSSTPSSTSSTYADSSRNDSFNSSLSINRTNFPNELNESLSKMNQHLKDHEENGNSMWRPW